MDLRGIEPRAFRLPSGRSAAELQALEINKLMVRLNSPESNFHSVVRVYAYCKPTAVDPGILSQ